MHLIKHVMYLYQARLACLVDHGAHIGRRIEGERETNAQRVGVAQIGDAACERCPGASHERDT